jgi:hypothetical protein
MRELKNERYYISCTMKPALTLLTAFFFSCPVMADDILYSYCQMPAGSEGVKENSMVLLSYNLSTAEEALYIREDRRFDWLAGRRPERDAGFEVASEKLDELNLALSLRESVARHRFYWAQSAPLADTFVLDQPEDCELIKPVYKSGMPLAN